MNEADYKPGLDGVIASITELSYLDTENEQIIIRGYDLIELIQKKKYLDVAYLLIHNKLPSPEEYKQFNHSLMEQSSLPEEIYDIFQLLPKSMSVMDALRTGISILGGYEDEEDLMNTSISSNQAKSLKILAQAPIIAVNAYRSLQNLPIIKPDTSLSYTENFIYMITGKAPEATKVDILDRILTTYIEHEMPNSTFTTRVIASTLSDIYGSVASAVASLKGPLHGGANEAAMKMFLEVLELGGPQVAEKYILDRLAKKEKVMGFGHRVYMKKYDPRAFLLKDYLPELVHLREHGSALHDIYNIIAKTVETEKKLYPNADYPIALLYYLIDIPIDLYTPIFLCSRIAGLVSHHIEQHANNRLFRPRVIYKGPRNLKV